MAITDWPLAERPREKLLNQGAKALSDAELLAIFLRTGVPGKSAVDVARDLLTQFGSLRKLLQADAEDFCQGLGLGLAKFVQLQAVLEMSRRHLLESLHQELTLTSSTAVKQYLKSALRHQPKEVFVALFLNSNNQLLAYEELFSGTLDCASVYPREVIKSALKHHAAAVIFAHNHPSGSAKASEADIHITRALKSALNLLDIRVLDHFIVGEDQITSLAEQMTL